MVNKTQPATSPLTRRERELLLSALGGAAKGLILSCGMVFGAGLLLTCCLALFRVSRDNYIVYSAAAFASSDFRHFLLLICSMFAFIMLVAIGFTWAFIRNLRDDKYMSDFLAYRNSRWRRKSGARRPALSLRETGTATSFLTGAASILDFGNSLAPSTLGLTPRQQDYLALKSDWAAVGSDLQAAVNGMDKESAMGATGATPSGGSRFA